MTSQTRSWKLLHPLAAFLLCTQNKPPGHALAATGVVGQHTSRLFYVTDQISGLVDTGESVSVIPPSPSECIHKDTLCLEAVNNTPITTYGSRSLTLDLSLRRRFSWAFIIANVRRPQIFSPTLTCWWMSHTTSFSTTSPSYTFKASPRPNRLHAQSCNPRTWTLTLPLCFRSTCL